MSELFHECNVHPTHEERFKRSVLQTLIARSALPEFHRRSLDDVNKFVELSNVFGVDAGFSLLVNECAIRIETGECSKYEVFTNGTNVTVTSRE